MGKIAFVLDSSCFLSESEVHDLGCYFIPLHVIIEGEDYLEGKNLDKDRLIQAIKDKKSVTTSQPSPGEVMELIKQIKRDGYDSAVVSMIGTGLSRTLENMMHMSAMEDFKLYAIDSGSVGNAQLYPLLKAKKLVESGMTPEQAVEDVKIDIDTSYTLLLPDDLFHLSRGGRITPTVAALGSMLKIKPILTLVVEEGGEIDIVQKVRTTKKAIKEMTTKSLKEVTNETHDVIVAHFAADEKALEAKTELEKQMPGIVVEIKELTTVIGVHTGLESVGIQVCRKF
ncbi:MAG: DegV family protein [Erysipelotrichales bacterium]